MPPVDRPISEVLQDIVHNIQGIVRDEVRLAKTEVSDGLLKAKTASVVMAAGALSAVFSTLLVLFAIVYGLSHVMPDWAAALTVGLALAIIAGSLLTLAMGRFKRVQAIPNQTMGSMKENVEWAKQQMR